MKYLKNKHYKLGIVWQKHVSDHKTVLRLFEILQYRIYKSLEFVAFSKPEGKKNTAAVV